MHRLSIALSNVKNGLVQGKISSSTASVFHLRIRLQTHLKIANERKRKRKRPFAFAFARILFLNSQTQTQTPSFARKSNRLQTMYHVLLQ